MKRLAYGAAIVGALGLATTAWSQTAATGTPSANTQPAPTPTAPAGGANTPQAAQATAPAKPQPQELATSPSCPPVHKRVAHRAYHRHVAASRSWSASESETSQIAAAPAPVIEVAQPPVYYAPPPVYYAPPPVYYAPPPPRPRFFAPWRRPWWRPWW